jgi:hypothetical protein
MERPSPARRKSLIALFLSNVLTKRILNKRKKYHNHNKKDIFPNWENDAHQKAAAGRDGWDEYWFPHETF